MVECIDIGSYIITIVVMMHGAVIELNISHDKQDIFENVHLLSLAGDFSETGLGDNTIRTGHLKTLNDIFQQNLNKQGIDVMQIAADRIRPAYADYMKMVFDEETSENSCTIFDNIQYDKAFGTGINGFLDRIMQCFLPDVIGIYVISVHKKIDNTTLGLIYPDLNLLQREDTTLTNLNLLQRGDLIKFAQIFNTVGEPDHSENIVANLLSAFSPWQPISSISKNDKTKIEKMKNWKVTVSSTEDILCIRLSYLIFIIKEIVGHDKCKMNIIDYSCSPIAEFISDADRRTAQYMEIMNIENRRRKFGGKNARQKRRTNRHYAKKRYTKKRHRKNKSSNNPIQKKQHKNT